MALMAGSRLVPFSKWGHRNEEQAEGKDRLVLSLS